MDEWEHDVHVCRKVYKEIQNQGYKIDYSLTENGKPMTQFFTKTVSFPPPMWQANSAVHELAHILTWPIRKDQEALFEAMAFYVQEIVRRRLSLTAGEDMQFWGNLWLEHGKITPKKFLKDKGNEIIKVATKIITVCEDE